MKKTKIRAEVEEFMTEARAAGQSDAKSMIGLVSGLIKTLAGEYQILVDEGALTAREATQMARQALVIMDYLEGALDVIDPPAKAKDLN